MRVGVDEAGNDPPPLRVDDSRIGAPQELDLGVAPQGSDPAAADGERLGVGPRGISGPDLRRQEDEVGRSRDAIQRHGEQGGEEKKHATNLSAAPSYAVADAPTAPEASAARAAARRAIGTRNGEHDT